MKTFFKYSFILVILSCNSKINFPNGGYPYPPDLNKIDTNFYCYPRDCKTNRKDSLSSTYFSKFWFKNFDEPNLSLRFQEQITFRLVYETAFEGTSIFTLTPTQIAVKRLLAAKFAEPDLMRLNKLEKIHLKFFQNHFPVEEIPKDYPYKKSIDSMVKKYPKLLDVNYYKFLLDKSIIKDSVYYKFSIKKIPISNSKFNELVNKINSSGYWGLPFHIKCDADYTDGYYFDLEANLPNKYNFVGLQTCSGKAIEFSWACQAIIDACDLEKKIKLISDSKNDTTKLIITNEVKLATIKNEIPKKYINIEEKIK